jgi:hypothetical protein
MTIPLILSFIFIFDKRRFITYMQHREDTINELTPSLYMTRMIVTEETNKRKTSLV